MEDNSFFSESDGNVGQKQENPFLEFGGNIKQKEDNPFSEFGGSLKKKSTPVVSSGIPSQLPSQPDFLKQGASLADNSFLKEISKSIPKGTGKPEAVEGKWSNVVQNVFANIEKTGTDIASGLVNMAKDYQQATNPYIPRIPSSEIVKSETPIPWQVDPLGNVIRGLHGNKERMDLVIQQNPLPNTFWGKAVSSVASFAPDIIATAALPEAKLAQGAGVLAKTGNLLFNNFTKYLTTKEGVVDYGKAREEGKDIGQASVESLKGAGKGLVTGVELALLGAGSNMATKSVMAKAEEAGLTGLKGIATKELVNLATDVAAFGLVSPYSHAALEGRLATADEIANGTGIAALFRIKGGLENIKSNVELNKALQETQALKQGVAISNFVDATPESIVDVYNSKGSADEFHLKALEATKKAKETTDLQKKKQLVAEAITYTKASNVKQVADMVINNRDGFAEFKASDLPESAKNDFLQKAEEINKLLNPFEKAKTDLDNKIKESEDLFSQLSQQAEQSQDPNERAQLEAQAREAKDNAEKFRNELAEVKFNQNRPDANAGKAPVVEGEVAPTGVKVTEDIEAQKADIEKRRKEELDTVIQTAPIEILDEKGNVVQTSDKKAAINAKYDAELSALEGGKTGAKASEAKTVEQLRKEEQAEYDSMTDPNDAAKKEKIYEKYDKLISPLLEKPKEQKITVELLSSQEPPQKEGETIVTLSGKTEAERLASIERRQSSTKVTDYVLAKNKIVQDATLYFKRVKENGRYKSTPQGRAELNDLRLRARELGLTVDTERDKVTMPSKKTGRPTKVSYDNTADSDAVVESSGKTLTERNRDVQEAFEELTEAGVFLDIKSESGNRMSAAQIDAAVSDILEGIPSKAANKYLDALEKGLAEDAIPLYDKGMGGFAPKLADIRARLGVEKETVGEPMDEVALNKFLDEESKLTPEEEQDLLDNVENLLY
jgi:hypothetical protein